MPGDCLTLLDGLTGGLYSQWTTRARLPHLPRWSSALPHFIDNDEVKRCYHSPILKSQPGNRDDRATESGFQAAQPPLRERTWIPAEVHLAVPEHTSVPSDLLHYLAYIPWDAKYLELVDPEYVDFFSHVLPYLHVRTTDVHVATCLPFAGELIRDSRAPVDARAVHIAFILHDSGWSQMTDLEIVASLGVPGLALSGAAVAPKSRHVELGKDLAIRILSEYRFVSPLTDEQKEMIYQAILLHDRPEQVASLGDAAASIRIVCDTDHLWSFTHEDFWQDTVRKGVDPMNYAENLGRDLDGYLVTESGKRRAGRMLQERKTEVEAWKEWTASAEAQHVERQHEGRRL